MMFWKKVGQAEFPLEACSCDVTETEAHGFFEPQKLHLPTLESTPKLSSQHQGTEQGARG